MTLQKKLEAGRFVVCGEITPPQSCDGDVIRDRAKQFKGVVDALNITDNQRAIVRLSSISSAKILLDEGFDPIMQMTCRDRNRLAMQSDLLGAAALGITNVLCLTGDHQTFGDQPEAKGVFDLDSTQLIAAVASMNRGVLLSGAEMSRPTGFLIGAAANPFAEPLEMRLIRLYKKIAAGARFIQTQAIFDLEKFSLWLEKVVDLGFHERAAIIAGIMPVRSAKTLLWMKEKLPGIRIHPEYLRRMTDARDPEQEGVALAVEMVRALKGMRGVRGIHIMPALWKGVVARIVSEADLHVAQ